MKKTTITSLIVILFLFAFYKITSQKPTSVNTDYKNADYVLFYGNTCPHCKDVDDFISKNQIDQKLKISKLEVYDSQSNATIFGSMVKDVCPDQLSPQGIPVPFLINPKDKKCFIGTPDITGYLTEKSK